MEMLYDLIWAFCLISTSCWNTALFEYGGLDTQLNWIELN